MRTTGHNISVPPFHSLVCGTVEQNAIIRNNTWNSVGTSDLKALAELVLLRNKDWNKTGTAAENSGTEVEQKPSPVEQWRPGDNLEERTAIIEHEAGIPREWAEGFARICCMKKPESINRHAWQRIIDNTGRLLDSATHLRDMVRFGWGITDIFGCHPTAPESRPDAKGLLLLFHEHEAIAVVDAKAIGLRNTRTGNLLFYRKPLNPAPERIMLWELK